MKQTKSLLIAALVAGSLFACNTALLAQDSTNTPPAGGPPPGGGMRGRMMGPTVEQLTTNLDLTADEIPKVQAVLDDQKKKMADMRADTTLSREDRRTKMTDIRTDVTAKMKDILTPDQFTKYQALTKRGGRRGGGNNGGGTPPTAPPQN
jgi:Spy/CpxP family protein refolding chaperone